MGKGIKVKRDKNLEMRDRRHVPIPTGPYATVGMRDVMTGTSKATGSLVRLFYPAADQSRDIRSQYLYWPNWLPAEKYREGYADVAGIKWNPMVRLLNWLIGDAFIPCVKNAKPLKIAGHKLPVVVLSHGVGGCRSTYSGICLELASQGFIVAAVEHRDGTACSTFYANPIKIPLHGENPDMHLPYGEGMAANNDANPSAANKDSVDEVDLDPEYVPTKALAFEASSYMPRTTHEWIPYQPLEEGDRNYYSIRNKQIHQRVRECIRALDLVEALGACYNVQNILDGLLDPTEFENIIDMDKVAIMGHSMGGATVLMSLATELRFKVGACLDAWMYPIHKEAFTLITQPVLFINMEKFQTKANLVKIRDLMSPLPVPPPAPKSPPPEGVTSFATFKSHLLEGDPSAIEVEAEPVDRKVVTIKGTVHYNPTDIPFVFTWLAKLMFGGSSRRSRFTAHDITTAQVLTFFGKNLGVKVPEEKEIYLNLQKKKLNEGISNKL